MNNTGLNCTGPPLCGCFTINPAVVPHHLWLIDSMDAEPGVQRANCELRVSVSLYKVRAPTVMLFKGQPYLQFRTVLWWHSGGWGGSQAKPKKKKKVWQEAEAFHPFTKASIRVGVVERSSAPF